MAAPDQVSVIINERNGINLQFQEEVDFLPENMPFSSSGFTADNVKSAIIEAKHFSIRLISSGETVIIPATEQMVLVQNFEISNGELELAGELAII